MDASDLSRLIADVPDFPSPGIVFKDITPLLASPEATAAAIELLAAPFTSESVDAVFAMESRGFIFGVGVAQLLGCAFVPVRKPGKLPRETVGVEYALEYGTDRLEIHSDAVDPGARVLIVDDVLATGGTAAATVDLCAAVGASVVGISVLLELGFLAGRDAVRGHVVHSVISV